MKGLNTLIKIKKKEIDEIKVKIGALENSKERLNISKQDIETDLEKQTDFIKDNPDVSFSFGPFYSKCKFSIERINQQIKKIDSDLDQIRNLLADLFGELKRFEILADMKRKAEEEKIKKEETKMFDEIGINRFLRNNEG